MESFDIVKIAVKAADSKKGKDIAAIKIRDVSVLADYFVLVTGDSSTQVKALADEIEFKLGEAGEKPHHISPAGFALIIIRWLFMFFTRSKGSIFSLSACGKTAKTLIFPNI